MFKSSSHLQILLLTFSLTIVSSCDDSNGSRQLAFSEVHITLGVEEPVSVAAVDIDGDGDVDVVVGDQRNDEVILFLNLNSLGEFGERIHIATLEFPRSIRNADIDADGDQDLVVANWANMDSPNVSWIENLSGNGLQWESHPIASHIGSVVCAVPMDADEDGDIDIIAAQGGEEQLRLFRNEGNGVFDTGSVIDFGLNFYDVACDDIDQDGDLDIAVASLSNDMITIYYNSDGLGHFTDRIVVSDSCANATSVCISDLDNDSDGDLVAFSGGSGPGSLAWYESTNGGETFIAHDVPNLLEISIDCGQLHDLDNDGDQDIVFVSHSAGEIVFHENLGSGRGYDVGQSLSDNVEGARMLDFADFDSDGDQDIVVVCNVADKVSWFKNNHDYVADSANRI